MNGLTSKQRPKLVGYDIHYSNAFQYAAIMSILNQHFELPSNKSLTCITLFEDAIKTGVIPLHLMNIPKTLRIVLTVQYDNRYINYCCWDCPDHHERHKVEPTPASTIMTMVLEMTKFMAN